MGFSQFRYTTATKLSLRCSFRSYETLHHRVMSKFLCMQVLQCVYKNIHRKADDKSQKFVQSETVLIGKMPRKLK